jgi:hypothetical protein
MITGADSLGIDKALQLRVGQQELTNAQQIAARQFVEERIQAHLSTTAGDEPAAEALLAQAYFAAGLEPPYHFHWLDGPLELVAVLARLDEWHTVDEPYRERVPQCVWDDSAIDGDEIGMLGAVGAKSVDDRIRRVAHDVKARLQATLGVQVVRHVWNSVGWRLWDVRIPVGEGIWRAAAEAVGRPLAPWFRSSVWGALSYSLWHAVSAYDQADDMADTLFFDTYYAPNEARALAQFSERVSGYWCGKSVALLVRRPTLLTVDETGQLHNAAGPCVEFPDGWKIYAWHGAGVPERVIVAPDELNRDDFFGAENLEARRLIQERMGARFVEEIGGRFIDGGPQGVLYEVELPEDPERVARYVQVLDPSTGREDYLRVPPTIASAEAAVAWTFGLESREYRPAQES